VLRTRTTMPLVPRARSRGRPGRPLSGSGPDLQALVDVMLLMGVNPRGERSGAWPVPAALGSRHRARPGPCAQAGLCASLRLAPRAPCGLVAARVPCASSWREWSAGPLRLRCRSSPHAGHIASFPAPDARTPDGRLPSRAAGVRTGRTGPSRPPRRTITGGPARRSKHGPSRATGPGRPPPSPALPRARRRGSWPGRRPDRRRPAPLPHRGRGP
jgi:hypothetical protein